VLISGSGGFVGSHLVSYFRHRKARVLGLSRHGKTGSDTVALDITDFGKLKKVVETFRPDAFFHLASDAIVESGQTDPYRTFHNNIISALNVLEIARTAKIPRLIMASTVHVYGDSPIPFKEDEPARPSRPYETSKTATDLIAQSYADTYGLPVLIPRFVNIYGPGDPNMTRIIPKTVTTIINGKQPTLWGGRATRDYLYIDDALRAYDLLGKISDTQIERNRIFNFATGRPVTAKQLIETILKQMDASVPIRKVEEAREHELLRQDVSFRKATSVLGWTPKTDLVAGLTQTIAWYRKHNLENERK